MQGKASRNILTFRLISLLGSFYFPSDSSFTAWYANLSIVHRKLRCLSVRERVHQPPTTKIRDSADSNGPRTKFALPPAFARWPRFLLNLQFTACSPRPRTQWYIPSKLHISTWPVAVRHSQGWESGLWVSGVVCINSRYLLLTLNEVYSVSCHHSRYTRKWFVYPLPQNLL